MVVIVQKRWIATALKEIDRNTEAKPVRCSMSPWGFPCASALLRLPHPSDLDVLT